MEAAANAMRAGNPPVFMQCDLSAITGGSHTAYPAMAGGWGGMGAPEIQQMMESELAGRLTTVLLVDDEEIVLEVTKHLLQSAGFEVLTAANGLEAVGLFEENSQDIDCVLMDCVMPVLNGQEALSQMRRIRTDVPVILTSGHTPDNVISPYGESPNAFLQKPYGSSSLLEMIGSVLGS